MRLRLTLACLVASTAAPLLVATPAHATPCVTTTRTITGTISGQDGRYVDAMLGFDLINSAGVHVNAVPGSATFGCTGPSGYGLTLRVNRTLPATGSTTSGTKTWKVVVPTNVKMAYIEVYPRAAGYGGTDESRYGHALRRKLPVPYGKTVVVKLPLICALGGKTGKIHGYVTKHGVRVQADRVVAWSMANDNNVASPILGWNMGAPASNGYYVVPNMPPGQYYTVHFTKDGVTQVKNNVWVNPCKATALGAAF
jgi:hypothetical protein